MANNERVSQLVELSTAELSSHDLLLITDMSQKESKKLKLGQLLSYVEISGSFDIDHSTNADTASYILGSGVNGAVALATSASYSITSSYSSLSNSSSYAKTASIALASVATNANTASYLLYSGSVNGTASYSLRSQITDFASSSFNLIYSGQPNGTASWAIKAVSSVSTETASYATNFSVGSSGSTSAQIDIRGAVNDGVRLLMSGSTDDGAFYIRTFDNGTEPVLFQSWDSITSPVDRMRLAYGSSLFGSALLTVYGRVSASYFEASNPTLGFIGTASYATSAGSVASSSIGPKFINPVVVANTTLAVSPTAFDCSPYVPIGTRVVILECWAITNNLGTTGYVNIRTGSLAPAYVLMTYLSSGDGNAGANNGQGTFPISSSGTFHYEFTQTANLGITLRLIGYY